MTEWCNNVLTLDMEVCEAISKRRNMPLNAEGIKGFYLTKITPMPRELCRSWNEPEMAKDLWLKISKLKDDDWRANGKLFDLEADSTGSKEGRVELRFETVWLPPISEIQELSRQFPRKSFVLDFHDHGRDFGGEVHFLGGEEAKHVSGDYAYYLIHVHGCDLNAIAQWCPISEENLIYLANQEGFTYSFVIEGEYENGIKFDEISNWMTENINGPKMVVHQEMFDRYCILLADETDYLAVRLTWI